MAWLMGGCVVYGTLVSAFVLVGCGPVIYVLWYSSSNLFLLQYAAGRLGVLRKYH